MKPAPVMVTPAGTGTENERPLRLGGVGQSITRVAFSTAAADTRRDTEPPAAAEQAAYLEFLSGLAADGIALEGVLLYGLARPSLQPEAARLSTLPEAWLPAFGEKIEALGVAVRVHQ